jgi:glycosyltransferase involved in cell wall biosynthesis
MGMRETRLLWPNVNALEPAARPSDNPGTVRRPLRVGLVSPSQYPLAPVGHGPVRQLLIWLAEELVALGHEVTVIGSGPDPGVLRAVDYHATFEEAPPDEVMSGRPLLVVEAIHALEATRLLAALDVDVIHDLSRLGPLTAAARRVPTVVTAHGTVTGMRALYYRSIAQTTRLVAISKAQQLLGDPGVVVAWAGMVHHGIPVADFPFQAIKKEYALWLGRVIPEKAPDLAITAARSAGIPLLLAGKCTEADERAYFEERVRPLLGSDVEWVGEVGGTHKLDLLAQACCLLYPLRWNDTFGLPMVEAMACGTPVIAMNRGAVAEVVTHGVTGYICSTSDELAEWIPRAAEIDPFACRQHVEAQFSVAWMTESYLAIYRQALTAGEAS